MHNFFSSIRPIPSPLQASLFHLCIVYTVESLCHLIVSSDVVSILISFIKSFHQQKAKKKKIDKKKPEDLDVDIKPHFETLSVEDPPVREAGIKVEDVDSLIGALKKQGLIKG